MIPQAVTLAVQRGSGLRPHVFWWDRGRDTRSDQGWGEARDDGDHEGVRASEAVSQSSI